MNMSSLTATSNLLPYDGVALYDGHVLSPAQAPVFFHRLLETIAWQNDEVVIFGKRITTARKVAWYGDQAYAYTYSNTTKQALPWTLELSELKSLIEQQSGESFNACLLNLYHHGGEGMGWHSDDEKSLVKDAAIASMSLGAERKFSFKHKQTKETVSIILESGSLLVMKEDTQTHWLHALPKTKKVSQPRINLTFRKMVTD